MASMYEKFDDLYMNRLWSSDAHITHPEMTHFAQSYENVLGWSIANRQFDSCMENQMLNTTYQERGPEHISISTGVRKTNTCTITWEGGASLGVKSH